VVRQNQRWDNARKDVKPSFVRENIQQIEYRLFEEDKYFNAGNEFRFVDFRSLNFPGQNTGRIDLTTNPPRLWIQKDKSRAIDAYAQYPDINGNYFVDNRDFGSGEISGNYILTTFTLQSALLPEADVYVTGAFNQWGRSPENKMIYNSTSQSYEATLLLKQGWYNYQYYVESDKFPPNHLEGNHFQTENVYEILVYYRPFQPNADLLIGYFALPVNAR
jgi:hypothetical protein